MRVNGYQVRRLAKFLVGTRQTLQCALFHTNLNHVEFEEQIILLGLVNECDACGIWFWVEDLVADCVCADCAGYGVVEGEQMLVLHEERK